MSFFVLSDVFTQEKIDSQTDRTLTLLTMAQSFSTDEWCSFCQILLCAPRSFPNAVHVFFSHESTVGNECDRTEVQRGLSGGTVGNFLWRFYSALCRVASRRVSREDNSRRTNESTRTQSMKKLVEYEIDWEEKRDARSLSPIRLLRKAGKGEVPTASRKTHRGEQQLLFASSGWAILQQQWTGYRSLDVETQRRLAPIWCVYIHWRQTRGDEPWSMKNMKKGKNHLSFTIKIISLFSSRKDMWCDEMRWGLDRSNVILKILEARTMTTSSLPRIGEPSSLLQIDLSRERERDRERKIHTRTHVIRETMSN